mmetsp:Transcript_3992/g.13972  ORF Transcript_3992/g.13972 Transcript_3992/m.13972 type:complete len:354 (-) Transcript_3992:1087-2148(-)
MTDPCGLVKMVECIVYLTGYTACIHLIAKLLVERMSRACGLDTTGQQVEPCKTSNTCTGLIAPLSLGHTCYKIFGKENEKAMSVVCIHGIYSGKFIWEEISEALVSSGACGQVLIYDVLGRGGSEMPQKAYEWNIYARQLIEILHYTKIRPPYHFMVYSMGLRVLIEYSEHFSENIHSVTVISSLFPDPKKLNVTSQVVRYMQFSLALFPPYLLAYEMHFKLTGKAKKICKYIFSGYDALEKLALSQLEQNSHLEKALCHAVLLYSYASEVDKEKLEKFKQIPCLGVFSEEDHMLPKQDTREKVESKFSKVFSGMLVMRWFDGGHFVIRNHTQRIAEEVHTFMQNITDDHSLG